MKMSFCTTIDLDEQHPSFKNRVDLQDRQMKDGDVSLILKDVTINDAATYMCRVITKETHRRKRANVGVSFIHLRVDPVRRNITAESGQNITLTCRAPNNNDIIIAVKWSRADLIDRYVFLYWDGYFLRANQHPSFKNRVDLQNRWMEDGNTSLILKNVTINDAGTYECRVQREGDSMKFISIIYLSVADPPGRTGGTVALTFFGLLLVAAAVGSVIYKKKENTKKNK
ncbi:matrix remodeling-associated protein 8-like [Oreochromis aureus]|uniref:matrix remodeling-associated protein 8-like n=1 Tax=Oreochromis aureus TaxID=47969 RepID=UPI001953024A|nr:matrix remodeling-associated protein 8-like [Oreochromis aureus]XP_039464622.1 matrix remodeling-associated protein 8-like [Oreochromis aureus]